MRDLLVHQGWQEEGQCTSGGGGPPALVCQEQNWCTRELQQEVSTLTKEVDPTDCVCQWNPNMEPINQECRAIAHGMGQSMKSMQPLHFPILAATTSRVQSAL